METSSTLPHFIEKIRTWPDTYHSFRHLPLVAFLVSLPVITDVILANRQHLLAAMVGKLNLRLRSIWMLNVLASVVSIADTSCLSRMEK